MISIAFFYEPAPVIGRLCTCDPKSQGARLILGLDLAQYNKLVTLKAHRDRTSQSA
jgi:hypothetical protein